MTECAGALGLFSSARAVAVIDTDRVTAHTEGRQIINEEEGS